MNQRDSSGLPLRAMVMVLLFLGVVFLLVALQLDARPRGLDAGARWSGMIHEPDSAETDPLQVARLQIEGVVDPLRGDRPVMPHAASGSVTAPCSTS